MVTRKNVVLAALFAVFIVLTLFATAPSRSSSNQTKSSLDQTSKYDAWADLRGSDADPNAPDGQVDMMDVGYVASLFGTSGDPSRNVTVTNWPDPMNVNIANSGNCPSATTKALNQSLGSGVVNQGSYWFSSSTAVDYYTQYYLYVIYSGPVPLTVDVLFTAGGIEYKGDGFQVSPPPYSVLAGPYAVKGSQMRICCSQAVSSVVPDYVTGVALYAYNS